MMRLKVFGAFAALALLAGCAGFATDIDRARTVEPQAGASAFNKALVDEYRALAIYEADEMLDWPDAEMFARKALAAADGQSVMPEELANWNLPAGALDELTAARAELLGLLDDGARDRFPKEAAHAQAMFDCWVEQQEENHQPNHIAACKDKFMAAMDKLRALMAPAPAPAPAPAAVPAPAAPETFTVYFDFDRDNIRTDAEAELNRLLAAAQSMGVTELSVTGHADRAGPADYNLRLSIRRAESVRSWLTGRGMLPDNISVAGRGEADPAVPTVDGVREQRNRRAVIVFQ